ncbi:diacylglycerol kinase family protein [Desertibaculum subflavum]|uniref:diacylglycerol kinase family protein n=1 Tax=Desertibaculum subflavum TaxID=2268458 RepID=UPI000E6646A2
MIQQGAVRIGVITNPDARRNRTDHAVLRALEQRPEIPRISYRGEGDLAASLGEMARGGITDLVVDGGDGTVVAAVSAALRVPEFARLPRLVVVPSGMTNLIAAEIGATAPRDAVIDRLLTASAATLEAATVTHAPMRIERGDALPPLHGFLLGAAAFHRGTLLSWERVHRLGATQHAAAGLGILANVWRAIFGADRQIFLNGDAMQVTVNGAHLPGERRFLLLLSTLDRLVLGLRPFWGDGDGGIRWLDVTAPPVRVFRALPRVLFGRPSPWMEAAGYRSGRADRIRLDTASPFIVDGEVVEPGPGGFVDITIERPFRFLRLS